MPSSFPSLSAGSILDNRYQIVRSLGRGGFGCTYLATDTHQQQDCVLKQFAPQVQDEGVLRKAKELFRREAGMLKRLKHERIPSFHQLLEVNLEGNNSLFLVQDYIDGKSYYELLMSRKGFNEVEVRQLLLNILPILEYIHGKKMIHRDISPDNLIRRNSDGMPVLIDFGCVKLAQTALLGFSGQPMATKIGKQGYSPDEQLLSGQVYPNSDLYALAVTAIVLLTGKQPDDLYDNYHGTWNWQKKARVSSDLEAILKKMLARQPGDRYQKARDVTQALNYSNVSSNATVNISSNSNVNSSNNTATTAIPTQVINVPSQGNFTLSQFPRSLKFGLLGAIALLGIMAIGLALVNNLHPKIDSDDPKQPLSSVEDNKQKIIYQRVTDLQINHGVFYEEVDTLFYTKYPALKGSQLSDSPEDKQFRQEWYSIAEDLLEEKESKNTIINRN